MPTIVSRRRFTAALALTSGFAALPAFAADDTINARAIIDEAAITVERVREETKGRGDLDDLLQRAKGVLIVPSYYKAGFIVGGAYGDGVLLARQPDNSFGDPSFYRMTSGSVGLQIGMQSAAMVFVILTERGLSAVLNDEFKLGANASMSIGTVGVGAEAATTTNIGKDIVAYSKNSGLFAGGALEGAVIRPRRDWNAAVYGVGNDNPVAIVQRSKLSAASRLKDVLSKGAVPAQTAEPAPSAEPAESEAPASQPVAPQ